MRTCSPSTRLDKSGKLCYHQVVILFGRDPEGRRVGMADEADSKSVVGNHVWVQVPPPALIIIIYKTGFVPGSF